MLHLCDQDCPFSYECCKHRVERWKGEVCLIKSQFLHEHTTSDLGDAFGVTRQWVHQTLVGQEDSDGNIKKRGIFHEIADRSKEMDISDVVIHVVETDSGEVDFVWQCPHCDGANRNKNECQTEGCDTHLEITLPSTLRDTLP